MKKCQFCAEEIQDAAIVCKHCGRELQGANTGAVTVRAKSRGYFRVVLLLAGALVVGVAGLAFSVGFLNAITPRRGNQYASGECRLSGKVVLSPYDKDSAILAVQNTDSVSWEDAQLSIYGQIRSGPDKGPAGIHKLTQTVKPGLNAIDLARFEDASGARWIPMMMSVEGIGIQATVRGEHCELEQSFH